MTLTRRIFTIQLDVEAPITVGGREICDVLSNAIDLGVGENHKRHASNQSGQFRDVEDSWDFNSPKVVEMKMAEEQNTKRIDTQFGPIFVKEEGK